MSSNRHNVLVARTGYGPMLQEELRERWGIASTLIGEDAVAIDERGAVPQYNATIFARQALPQALALGAQDCQQAAHAILRRIEVATQRANRQTGRWTLHAFALDDNAATQHATRLEKQVLALVKSKLAKFYKRYVAPDELLKEDLSPHDFVIQIYVPSLQECWLSIAAFTAGVSPYIGGNLRMRAREGAPSRSARKLEEAFMTFGRLPQVPETAVDLGAAPGGWTFILARRGARVVAVDAADLVLPETKSLMERVTHVRDNGLRYQPERPVDWLVCDMIVAPHETLRVLSHWLEKDWMRHFVVNLKLPKSDAWAAIRQALDLLDRHSCPRMQAMHLYHDRWEITLFGSKDALLDVQSSVAQPDLVRDSVAGRKVKLPARRAQKTGLKPCQTQANPKHQMHQGH